MHRFTRAAASCGAVAALSALLPLAASAHEHREVGGGQYEMVVGFLDEPAFVGEKNGLSLAVHRPAGAGESASAATPEGGAAEGAAGAEEEGTPVEGLARSLQAEVIFGEETMALELSPAFGEPGAYESVFFPMAEGDYTFRIFGDVEGVAVDERFTSAPDTFSSVEAVEPLQFPKGDAGVEDALVVGGIGDASGGFPGGPGGGLLLGALGLAGVGLALARRHADRFAPRSARA